MSETFGSENDRSVVRAYSLMAMNESKHVWSKFAATEIETLLTELRLQPHASVIDVGCGSGRHSLELAKRGFRVRAFDYVEAWVKHVQEAATGAEDAIKTAGGKLTVEQADARQPPLGESADLVLCLYDVIGSSESPEDAARIVRGLFRLCKAGGTVVLGCMSGTQLLRGLPADRFVLKDPVRDDLQPVSAMQNCGEVFDFSKMFYNAATGVLFRREQFTREGEVVEDSLLKERRFLPSEIVGLLRAEGFVEPRSFSVRAGRWHFDAPFDAAAPEVLFVAQRPSETLASIPRVRLSDAYPSGKRGYSLLVVPRDEITLDHAAIVSRIFCTSFGKNPKTGRNHVLGSARMNERLQRCAFLCLTLKGQVPVGYMFGTTYKSLIVTIAWLDSICVVRENRRQGLATAMLDAFTRAVPQFEWLGATTPNPITKLVLEKANIGKIFGPGEPAPAEMIESLEYIKPQCEDLRGCDIDAAEMRIQTRFNVRYDDAERAWSRSGDGTSEAGAEPAWWTRLANLPEDYESLLLIHRESLDLFERRPCSTATPQSPIAVP